MTDEPSDELITKMAEAARETVARLSPFHGLMSPWIAAMRAALKLLPKPEVKVTEEMVERAIKSLNAGNIFCVDSNGKALAIRVALEYALTPPPQVPEPTEEEIKRYNAIRYERGNWTLSREQAIADIRAVRRMDMEKQKS